MKKVIFSTAFSLMLSACSKDYTPPANATGEQIYQQACMECHPTDNTTGAAFEIDEKLMTHRYIALRVNRGSLMMPKFPNIKGKQMKALTQYVLEHSVGK